MTLNILYLHTVWITQLRMSKWEICLRYVVYHMALCVFVSKRCDTILVFVLKERNCTCTRSSSAALCLNLCRWKIIRKPLLLCVPLCIVCNTTLLLVARQKKVSCPWVKVKYTYTWLNWKDLKLRIASSYLLKSMSNQVSPISPFVLSKAYIWCAWLTVLILSSDGLYN